jgi:RsiW-degrading membrane proteinase PrsW (M82 family)
MNTDLFEKLLDYNTYSDDVDVIIVLLFVIAGYFLKKYFIEWKLKMVYKVFLVGTVLTVLYLLSLYAAGVYSKVLWKKWLISYALATSLYESILKLLENRFQFLRNDKELEATTDQKQSIETDGSPKTLK